LEITSPETGFKKVDRSLPAYVKRIGGHPEVRDATVNACYEFRKDRQKGLSHKGFVVYKPINGTASYILSKFEKS